MIRDQHRREQGYRLLMNAYQEPLYWHIRRIVLTHEDANDVVQNVWIKIFKNIERFKGDSKLFTWMYKIATNEALTHIKKIQRKHAVSLDDENAVIRLLKADDYFEGSDIEAQLHAAISKLPEKQKLVFNMRYFDDMSYKEMQKVLGTSIGALKASYHHAVKKIEQFIMQSEKT
ncbi:MAG: sigma-70 family RNA polymerase sigma factor [Bacteroidia bacterium]|nr:sigma-70 family RNA polymerase sigma factor [Bacteroidia bacterium]